MTFVEAIESCIAKRGMNKSKLAEKMGMKRPQVLVNQMSRKNGMRTDTFLEIAEALGYDVVLKDKISGEEIVVTAEEEK